MRQINIILLTFAMKTKLFGCIALILLFATTLSAQEFCWEQTNGPYGGVVTHLTINSSDDIFAGTYGAGMFRSINNGNNWIQINNGLPFTHVNALAISPTDDIFVGFWGLFRSTDNGDSWTQINTGLPDYIDPYCLAINSSDYIFVGILGKGVFMSTDNGESWKEINSGLTNTQVLAFAIDSNGYLLAGTYGGVFRGTLNTEFPTGDVSGDYSVSAYDAALILQYVVGIIDHFPVDEMQSPTDAPARNYTIRLPELAAKAGTTVQIPIVIDDATGLMSGSISIKFDRNVLRAVNVAAYEVLDGAYWQSNTNLAGEVRIAFAAVQLVKTSGRVVVVEFEVLANTEGQVSPLIFDTVDITGSLNITKYNGSVTVLPNHTVLLPNYPNPFNPETWIPFKLARNAPVTINIYNTEGQLIRTITLGNKNAGVYVTKDKAAYWDGKDSFGDRVASGVYYYTLQAGEFRATRKMLIVK